MAVKDLVKQNRSYRRFVQQDSVTRDMLLALVDSARLTPSAANRQVLRYYISYEAESNAAIFPHLGWAGYLREWPGPEEGERPAAYIILLQEKQAGAMAAIDCGIAAQTILLQAVEAGLGGCLLANLDKTALRQALNIADRYEILLVVALGTPQEEVVIEELQGDGDVKYWRDVQQVHHVPKRALRDILLND